MEFSTIVLFYVIGSLSTSIGDSGRRIPIGAIFDHAHTEQRSAFSYEILNTNTESGARVKFDANSQKIDTDNAFWYGRTMCSLMANGIFALFGTHTPNTFNTVMTFTKAMHMPYITTATATNHTSLNLGYMLHMRPLYTHAIIEVVKYYHWEKVYYFYQDDDGLRRLENIFEARLRMGVKLQIKVFEIRSVADAVSKLDYINKEIDNKDSKAVLLDLPNKDCEQILLLQRNEAWRTKYHYLVTGLGIDELKLKDYAHGGINMTGFRLVDFHNQTAKSFLDIWSKLDKDTWNGAGSDTITYEAALAVDSVKLIAKALGQLIKGKGRIYRETIRGGKFYNNQTEGIDCDSEPTKPWVYGDEIIKSMRQVVFWGLSGKIAFDEFGLRKDYVIDVLETTLTRGMAKIASWGPGRKGWNIHPHVSLIRDKIDSPMEKRTRIVTSILSEPYLIKKINPDPDGRPLVGNAQYEGYCVELAERIAEVLYWNETDYLIVPVKDGKYGAINKSNHWNGMVGELIRNEADLAIAPLTITADRERVIDFSKPFMSLGISIMIKKTIKAPPGVFSFMYPLSWEIWMCVIFAYIGVSVVLFLVSRFSPFEWHIEDTADGPNVTNNFTIFNSLWFALGAFMQQGADIEPRSLSGRIVGTVWWFFTLIIISSYTANLAAFLTSVRMKGSIESAEDLAGQTEIKYGTIEGGSTREFFKQSSIQTYERMWSFMSSTEPSVFVSSNAHGIERVRNSKGKYAFLTESTTNNYANQRKPCDTVKVGGNLDSKGYGIGTPLGSDLRDRITLAVLELRENGVLQKLEKRWWIEMGECSKDDKTPKRDPTSSLKIMDVAGIFFILIGGIVISIISALIEFMYKSSKEARRRKTSFRYAVKSKARLSIKGSLDETSAVMADSDIPPNMSISTYTYAPAAQLVSLDGYVDGHTTHTQV